MHQTPQEGQQDLLPAKLSMLIALYLHILSTSSDFKFTCKVYIFNYTGSLDAFEFSKQHESA